MPEKRAAAQQLSDGLLLVAMLIFFASGFSALLYQVTWQRMLTAFAGSDIRSATLVIGGFLAGLGLGSLVAGRYADRFDRRKAMAVFALSNLIIAGYGLLSKFIFCDLLVQRLAWLSGNQLVGFLLIFISLLLPTLLMGLSLPFISRAVVTSVAAAPKLIGLLYSSNTLGCVYGAWLGGLFLIPRHGYQGTLLMASAVSLLVAGAAFWLALRGLPAGGGLPAAAPGKPAWSKLPGSIKGWAALAFVAGFIAIALELVWFRLLGVLLHTNAYTFAHLLGFVLAGYGFGSLYGSRKVAAVDSPQAVYGRLFVYAVAYAGLSTLALSRLGPAYNALLADGWMQAWFLDYILVPGLVLLPPNFLIGFSFVLLQKGIQTSRQNIAARVALLQLVGTLGNVAGSILTGLVLLHYLGTSGALRVIIAACGLLAVLQLRNAAQAGGWRRQAAAVALALFAVGALLPGNLDLWKGMHAKLSGQQLLVVEEDSSGVSALLAGERPLLTVNAEVEGDFSYRLDSIHSALGLLGTLIHPNPQDIFVLGVGSGNTPVAAGFNPATQTITAVEIVSSQAAILERIAAGDAAHPVNILFEDTRYTLMIGMAGACCCKAKASSMSSKRMQSGPTRRAAARCSRWSFSRLPEAD